MLDILAGRDSVHLGSVRCRGHRDALRERRRVETALRDVSGAGAGLPLQSLLFVRRLAPPVRLAAKSAPFAASVRTELERMARVARRPWLHAEAASAEAVLFADEAELAACLIRDRLRGFWTERWWWRELLGSMSVDEWLRRHVIARADVLAAATQALAGSSLAVPWYACLPAASVQQARISVEAAFGIPARFEACPTLAPATVRAARESAGGRIRRESGDDGAIGQLLRRAPEVAARSMTSGQRELLAVMLAIRRDLVWARSPSLVRALAALRDGDGWSPGSSAGTRAASIAIEERDSIEEVVGRRPRAQSPAPGSKQTTGMPRPAAATVGKEASAAVPAVAPPAGVQARARIRRRSGIATEAGNISGAATSTLANADPARTESMAVPAVDAGIEAAPGASVPASPTRMTEIRREQAAAILAPVPTAFGGIFYLLNVALALNLYGDFTMPRFKGLALSPWDWLAMIGSRWYGREFRKDPLWKLLAELAGHPPRRRPERGFRAPGRLGVERWFAQMSAQLLARLERALGPDHPLGLPDRVCRFRAHIYKSATSLDVHLDLADLPISLRIGGLDRDPGWIPAAGRSIRFHFA